MRITSTTGKVLILFILLLRCNILYGQAPQQFSFQGVARNAEGKVIANTSVSLRLTIHETLPNGLNIYQETHKPQTSNGGIFTVSVGTGNDKSGSIEDIKWSAGSFFLQVELDVVGGTNYIDLGAAQLLSVPYALHAAQADKWRDGDPVVQKGELHQGSILTNTGIGSRLIWHPRKAAFRAGYVQNGAWNDANIGYYSVSFGSNTTASKSYSVAAGNETIASEKYSVAMGNGSISSGEASVAMGSKATASGTSAIAMGNDVEALGSYSFSVGNGTVAKSVACTSLGSYNENQDYPSPNISGTFDRIFQIGNGLNEGSRSNALTVLRNGNLGLGNNVRSPQFILDIGSRARIRHNPGLTAGLFFDNSSLNPVGFVGLKSDNEIGFFIAGKWSLWVDNLGNAHISGSNYNTSDRRLKRNFSSLSSSLNKLSDLNGYNYFWKDSTLDQTLQTGLIAQEVETHFPELVKTDDKGFKSVNYTGLIPHLIESVKELKASVEYLQTLNASVEAQNEELKAQASEMDSFRKELKALQAVGKVETASSNTKLSEK